MLTKYLHRSKQILHRLSPKSRAATSFNRSRNKEFYQEFWRAPSKNIGANLEDLGYEYKRIIRGDQWTIVNRSSVMIDDHLTLKVMGNKPLTYRLLSELGSNVPRHAVIKPDEFKKASRFLGDGPGKIVVKPAMNTGAGRGVTTGIKGVVELKKAIDKAAIFCSQVLLEDQLELKSYRLLFLDGKLIDAVHRGPPSITGDGVHTIDQLVDFENDLRKKSLEVRSLFLINKDLEYEQCLKGLGFSKNYVPSSGEVVPVKTVINQNCYLENAVVLSRVSKSIESACEDVCKKVRVKLAGVDLMAQDVGASWGEGVIINEINTTPGLHHHYLVKNKDDRNQVAEKILEYLLTRSEYK